MFKFLKSRRAESSPPPDHTDQAKQAAPGAGLGAGRQAGREAGVGPGGQTGRKAGVASSGQVRLIGQIGTRAQGVSSPVVRIDPEPLLRRLEWTVLKRLDGLLQGDYRTLHRGHGFDLADLREYMPHDDVRHIDWNVTARLQIPHVREHQEDREVSSWLILDLSGSVGFGSGTVSKRMLGTEFAAVMARLLTRRGNRVGALLHTGRTAGIDSMVPARSGRQHVLHLIARAAESLPAERSEATDLARLLADARATIRRRSAVFVVSDFISQPGWEAALGMLAQRHDVVAVRLYDPVELALPDLGLLGLRDAETGELLWVDSGDAAFRKRFETLALEREQNLRQALAKTGVDCLELATDEPLDEALMRFVQMRRRRAQQTAAAAKPASTAA
jgi:uncharacterized protein (DUF58 family)